MKAERQASDNADAAAASHEHVRCLQSQLQSTAEQSAVVEQVVGASGSQAVEPAATTAQPGVPHYVVPPATSDLAFGRSHWDGKPADIHAMILKYAGPLTRFLIGLLGDTATLDDATKLELWTEAFKMDWQGDLALLPDVDLTADNGLLLAHSRSMYHRLCKRFPDYTDANYASNDEYYNNYSADSYDGDWDGRRLLLIPMRHGWFDLIDFTYPITLAQMAIRFGCLDLLKHLDDKYKTLQDWMARHEPTSDYWDEAVDIAASNGHLDVMQYLFDLGVVCMSNTMDSAAANGHLHVVKWLHENRTEGCTYRAMDWAAGHGHLHVLKWLHANRTEGCTAAAMDRAAKNGHLHVIEWLHETRGFECTTAALDAAIRRGHLDVIKYMHSKGARASSDTIESSVRIGSAKLLQYLMECGYAVELKALSRATTTEISDLLLGSLTLDQAQALLVRANQADATEATIKRLESTIQKLETSSK